MRVALFLPSSAGPLVSRPRRSLLAMAIAAGVGTAASAQVAADASSQGAVLPTVSVKGAGSGDSPLQQLGQRVEGGALGARSQLETPFSTTIVSRTELEERPVDRLGDIFGLDAAVSDNSAAYGAWATYLSVRGLPLDWQNGFRIDGHPFLSYTTTLPLEQLEQVELLKGAQGFLYGFGSPGGVVNYVTRKPPTQGTVRSVSLGYGNGRLWRGQLDLGGRAGVDDMFGYRLNLTREEGRTVNDGSMERSALSVALDARLTRDLSWDFQSVLQDRHNVGTEPTIQTGTTTTGLPAPVGADDTRIVGAGSFVDNRFRHYATGLKYALSPDWTLSGRYAHSATSARRNETVLFLTDNLGNYNDTRSDYAEHYQFNNAQVMLEGAFKTGSIGHRVVTGFSSQTNKNDYSPYPPAVYSPVGTGNLNAPNPNAYYSVGGMPVARSAEIQQRSLFVSDTLQLAADWSAIVGLRSIRYHDKMGSYEKKTVTPTLALMYQVAPRTMVYGSYVESLEPGSVVGVQYDNRGTTLAPVESKQYEIGVKTDQPGWAATAAVFRIERGAEYVDASVNELKQGGEALYEGLELAGVKRFGRNFEVGGSLMHLESKYGSTYPDPGKRVVGAPELIATVHASYRLPQLPGLKLRADAKYTGDTMLRSNNSLAAPAFTVLNLGASYDARVGGNDVTYRLAVRNALDKKYWLYQYANYVKAGDPRTVTVSASVNF